MADVASTLAAWSTTAASNLPTGATPISSNLDDNLRQIQAVVRQLASSNTIASATTTDLSTVNEAFVTVTGTTTITGLGTVSAGIYKWLTFSGALTLTHNATSLIIPGGANITTAANDTCLVKSLGSGNWQVYLYARGTGTGDFITNTTTSADGEIVLFSGTGGKTGKRATTTGILKGTSGVLSAATAGTDYADVAFKTIAVSGQSDVVADSAADTLTLAAGSGITITTNAATDTVTIASTSTAPNVFQTISVSGQSDVVADQASDTLTFAAGSNITITTNASTDTITFTANPPLAALTPTASAAVNFLSTFTSTYDNYLIIGNGIKPAADDQLLLQLAASGSADTGSNYYRSGSYSATAVTATSTSANITNTITSAGKGCNFTILVLNANDATNLKTIIIDSSGQTAATPGFIGNDLKCHYNAANAVTGGRLIWGSGSNFAATGKVFVFGFNNS